MTSSLARSSLRLRGGDGMTTSPAQPATTSSVAGGGNDVLWGGAGKDLLSGGLGRYIRVQIDDRK